MGGERERAFDRTLHALDGAAPIYEDDDVLVANKPVGMSVDAADREQATDLMTALRTRAGQRNSDAWRAQQHLDRDVSGVVLVTKSPQAARKMAAGEAIRTTFVAAVSGRSARQSPAVLRGWLAKRGGKLEVLRHQAVGAAPVQVEVRSTGQAGDRSVWELRSTASARHVRELLAAHGLGVAGDSVRGGPSWHRVMLHAAEVRFVHPATGQVHQVHCDEPWEFQAWVARAGSEFGAQVTSRLFSQAALSRSELGRIADAYRLFHGEGEGLPGIDLDRFVEHLVLWVDEQTPPTLRDRLVQAAWDLGPRGLYLKVRPRAASRLDEAARAALAPPMPVRGEPAPAELWVSEHGLSYLVRLDDGLATGLFLDQRGNRQWVQEQARGGTVLNLFAYTCAFTVAAAAGGADATVSVDISARALETGRRNLQAGGLDGARHEMVRDDVTRWVHAARAKSRRFDLIVLDPPSFGSTRHGRFSAEADYGKLVAAVVGLLSDRGGVLLACTNHRGVSSKRFRGWLQAAASQAGREVVGMKEVPPGVDFPTAPGGEPHMKAFRVWVGPK